MWRVTVKRLHQGCKDPIRLSGRCPMVVLYFPGSPLPSSSFREQPEQCLEVTGMIIGGLRETESWKAEISLSIVQTTTQTKLLMPSLNTVWKDDSLQSDKISNKVTKKLICCTSVFSIEKNNIRNAPYCVRQLDLCLIDRTKQAGPQQGT